MNIGLVICGLVSLLAIVYAQNACVTPNGEKATCIPFVRCRSMIKELSDSTNEFDKFLRESICEGSDNETQNPMVCCGIVARYQTLNIPGRTSSTQQPIRQRPKRPLATRAPTPVTGLVGSLSGRYTHRNLNLLPPVGKCGTQLPQDRLFGADQAGIDEFPWMALLDYQRNGKSVGHSCGGMIINEKYVLTAAHCIVGSITVEVGQVFRVRLGEYDRSTTKDCVLVVGGQDCALPHQDILIQESFAHADYTNERNQPNDIGILRLVSNIVMNDFVNTICLPIDVPRTRPGNNLTAVGWGFTENHAPSLIKLKVKLPVVADQQCRAIFKNNYNLQLVDSQLCAGAEKGRDSCRGDSGGPLIAASTNGTKFFVEGIVSFGAACGTEGVPGIYTRVSPYLDWILDHMNP